VEDLLSAAADLAASPSLPHHAMGLALEIQLGSDRALSQAIQEVDQLKESGKFRFVTTAIGFYSHGPTAIPLLSRAVRLHSTATGFDDAIASALGRMIIGNRTVVPAMARLLESADSTAALRAASFFSTYALLCDAHGNVREGEPDGPFATEETRAYRPGYDPNLRAEDCVRFWQHWWKANAAKLGFGAD
jgi:hypothetical protein